MLIFSEKYSIKWSKAVFGYFKSSQQVIKRTNSEMRYQLSQKSETKSSFSRTKFRKNLFRCKSATSSFEARVKKGLKTKLVRKRFFLQKSRHFKTDQNSQAAGLAKFLELRKRLWEVGGVVTSDTREPRFESQYRWKS